MFEFQAPAMPLTPALRPVAAAALLAVVAAGCSASPSATPSPSAAPGDTAVPAPVLRPPYAPGWSAVHADARNSDYAAAPVAADLALAWSTRLEAGQQLGPLPWSINLGPTLGPGGGLYVTSTAPGCHLRALDAATGELRWCAPFIDALAVVSSPTVDLDGALYLADGAGLHAISPDGSERWRVPLEGVPLSLQFTPDGRLVFVTNIGVVYLVDRLSGSVLGEPLRLAPGLSWRPADGLWACARGVEGCPSANTLAVDPASGTIYFTFWAPGAPAAGLRAMRYRPGQSPAFEPLWENDSLPGGTASSPALSFDGRRLYVTDNQGSLHAIDAATGRAAWSLPIGYPADGSASVSPEGLIIPAGGRGGWVLAVRDEGDRGVLAWERRDLPNRGVVMQAAGGRAYAAIAAGDYRLELVVLDARDGAELDREVLPGQGVFSVGTTAALDGTVFVATITGWLAALR
ncbi:PQQ-binding-like beta-propeller repeat protein [Tepidiforma sp.]|uniref:outer membrane protein assembly factor BamB family protein n=1 Tax=Tepidiforma sp. TaxID=2682230 RepID=UPI00262C2BB2|nr:PQQ-binding-like beta-propeller repeat protein [Tepidiforma sp.]MCX7617007.1 PQQ-like beta-propeller repeat protein [Tepidiforma sp.]